MAKRSKQPTTAHQYKLTLQGVRPRIWRQIQVPSAYSFWDLHVALQDAMGWLDCHLHVFRVADPETDAIVEIGIPDEDAFVGDAICLAGWDTPIARYFIEVGDRAAYKYDFGDGWEHELVLEQFLEPVRDAKYPQCMAGARACPPEDCGGPWGYKNLLKIVANPLHEERASMLEWLGGSFDPEAFDPARVKFSDPKKRWKVAFGGG